MSRALALLLVVVPSLAVAEGKPLPMTKLDRTQPLPGNLKAKGKQVIDTYAWKAPDGTASYLVLSSTPTKSKAGPGRDLFAQIFGGKKLRETRLVKDAVTGCKLDVVASFVADSVMITDVDADGTPEVSFAYDVNCSATFDPGPRKWILIEGATKHALRGVGLGGDPDGPRTGGEFKPEGFAGQPELRTWAEARWKALLPVAPRAVDD